MPKRVTAKEIAQALGISTMTVSRALNNRPNVDEKTRQKVLETARKMGYIPNLIAKSLVLRKTSTIGVVVPEITHSFFPEVVRGIEEVSYQAGYHIILAHTNEDAQREISVIQTLISKQVDGLLVSISQSVENYEIYRQVTQRGLPLVFYDRCVKGLGVNCVRLDDRESAAKITRHLIEHGYDRIAHISGPQNVLISEMRLKGFQDAVLASGMPWDENLVVQGGFHEESGYRAMKQLLDLPVNKRPRAVVAVNDPAAFGAMKAILEAGLKIPQDVAIVGFSDDIRAELMVAPLTTIRQNAYEIGRRAAIKLIDLIEEKTNSVEEIVIHGELVVRRSCGC